MSKVRWRSVYTHGRPPTPRCAHTLGFSETKGLVVYGGRSCSQLFLMKWGWDGKNMLGDLCLLNLETMTWSRPMSKGLPPGSRAGHTATVVGDKCFCFGGGDGQQFLSDMVILDLNTMEWTKVAAEGGPSPRSRHSSTLIGGTFRTLSVFNCKGTEFSWSEVEVLTKRFTTTSTYLTQKTWRGQLQQ